MANYLDPKNDLTFKRVFGEHVGRAAYTKEQLQTYDKWKINMLAERGMIDDAREEGKTEGKHEIALTMLKMVCRLRLFANIQVYRTTNGSDNKEVTNGRG